MKNSKKLIIGILAFAGLVLAGCGEKPDTPVAHECTHVCPVCEKCTDANCTDPVCAEKCQGHDVPVPHTCQHVCPTCSKCTDSTCTDTVCADKCQGHGSSDTHVCNHKCPNCGKCTDDFCFEPECSEKCPGNHPAAKKTYTLANGFLMEAEDGVVDGTMTGTDPTDAFVAERSSNNPDHPTSGGKVVFCWAAAGNTVTWTFDLTDNGNAKLILWCCAASNQNASGLGLTVNGKAVSWKESTVIGKGNENKWYYWNPITATADLVKGENTIVITNVSGESWNLDCMNVVAAGTEPVVHTCGHVCPTCSKCTDATCTDPACASKCAGHSTVDPTYVAVTFADGKAILEAEDGVIEGTMTSDDPNDTFVASRDSNNTDHPTSGGKVVFCWAAAGNTVTWYIDVPEANAGNYKFKFWCCAASNQASSGLGLTVNGSALAWEEDTVLGKGFSDGMWYYWNPIVATGTLKAGHNVLVITNVSGQPWNLDCLELINYVPTGHVCSSVCQYCGKCTNATCTDDACSKKCAGHNIANFVQGVYRMEVENGELNGGCTVFDAGVGETLSGGKGVGDFNYGQGNTHIVLRFVMTNAGTYNIKVAYACGLENNYNGAVEIEVNGNHVNGLADHDGHNFGQATDWHSWATDISASPVELKIGENTIDLLAPFGSYTNLDYVEVIEVAPAHVCGHICEECGGCTDAACSDAACAQKCTCGQPQVHTCSHKCPTCGKCMDATCTDSVCSEKCTCEPAPVHTCEHVCATCGKCTDATCTDAVCANKCTCPTYVDVTFNNGKLNLEAEDGDIKGTMTGTDPTDAFVGVRSASNPDTHATSGGKVVFCWAAQGNTVTWYINVPETDAGEYDFTFWCCAGGNQASSGLGISVNGTAKSWNEDTVLGKGFSDGMWYYWNPVTTRATLVAGQNTIVITNLSGQSWNLDNLELVKYVPSLHVCGHVCQYCGKCTDATCEDTNCSKKCSGHNVLSFTDGKYLVPGANAAGEYEFYADEATTVYVEFRANYYSSDLYDGVHPNDNNAVEMYINGGKDSNDKKNFGTSNGLSVGDGYLIYQTGGTYELVEGKNVLKIVVPYQSNVTYDWFKIVKADTARHACGHVCETCGKCTDANCEYYACFEKCAGHGGTVTHTCEHVCTTCGGCLDDSCTDPACATKCSCQPAGPTYVDVTFTNDTLNLEAEDGVIAGTMTGTDATDAFVGVRSASNPDTHETSGGKVVFCWAAQGNTVTWYINVPEENAGEYNFTFWCCAGGNQASSGLGISVNGTAKSWNEDTVLGKGFSDNMWYYWNPITTRATLVAGQNTIVITNASGQSWNLDNLVLTKYVAPSHVCGHVCEYCSKCADTTCEDAECATKCNCNFITLTDNKYRFEAENGALSGCSANNGNGTEIISGGGAVGDFNYGAGSSITIKVVATEEGVYNLDVRYACGLENNNNGAVEVTLDGTKVQGSDGHDGNNFGKLTDWHDWATDTSSSTFTLTKGVHTFVLTAPYGSYTNVDYIELVKYVAPVHTCEHVCETCGKCTDATCENAVCAEKCTCPTYVNVTFTDGALNLEAENGVIAGTMTGTDPGDAFVAERTSNNTDHPTSGDKVVFCWAAQGNTVTWYINVPEADAGEYNFTFWCCAAFNQDASGLGISVNGTAKSWNEDTIIGKGNDNQWYYWNPVTIRATLVAGHNTIVITNLSGQSWNLDNLVLTKYVAPSHVCQHVCPYCNKCMDTCEETDCAAKCTCKYVTFTEGKYRVEAENFNSNGTHAVQVNDSEGYSGGKTVGDFCAQADLTYKVIVAQETTVKLTVAYGLGQNGSENGAVELYVNGTRVHGAGSDDNIGMTQTQWAPTSLGDSATFTLAAGENTIKLCAPWGSAGNLDYFDIVVVTAE